jgi:hypothetical protein
MSVRFIPARWLHSPAGEPRHELVPTYRKEQS